MPDRVEKILIEMRNHHKIRLELRKKILPIDKNVGPVHCNKEIRKD